MTTPAGTYQTAQTLRYDPLMRLAELDSSNVFFDVALAYDGPSIVFETMSGGRTRRYVQGPGADEQLVSYVITPTASGRVWYHGDERGSMMAQSNDAGTVTGFGRFDEYGVGEGFGRFRYTGQYWLAEAGLHSYKARVYDARLGRFLQPDPIGYGSGTNLYAYILGAGQGGLPLSAGPPGSNSRLEEEPGRCSPT